MSETTFLTPGVSALLAQLAANPSPPDYAPAAQRAALNGAMAALGWSASHDASSPTVVDLPSGATVHVFHPAGIGAPDLPVAIYLHGGSFFAGGRESHGPLARTLADTAGCAVALVDYRLAPEHAAPAALDDCVAATQYLVAHANELGLSSARIALVGDSAGGYLAGSTAMRLHDLDISLSLLVMINPMIGPAHDDGSMRRFATGFFASAEDFDAGWRAYRSAADDDVLVDLLGSSGLGKFPETLVITNEADPVRDQGEQFAERLSQANVPVTLLRARGLIHAAWLFPNALPEAKMLMAVIGGAIGTRLRA